MEDREHSYCSCGWGQPEMQTEDRCEWRTENMAVKRADTSVCICLTLCQFAAPFVVVIVIHLLLVYFLQLSISTHIVSTLQLLQLV